MSSRISSKSCRPIRRRRIVHSRSTNPDLSERLNVTPALFAVYLNSFSRPQLYKAVNGYLVLALQAERFELLSSRFAKGSYGIAYPRTVNSVATSTRA